MKKVKKSETPGEAADRPRQARLAAHRERAAAALRENLRKRKAQIRGRGSDGTGGDGQE